MMTMEDSALIPSGLEHLVGVDMIHIKGTRQMFQDYATYDLLTADGHLVYQAKEKQRFCGPRFEVWVRNLKGHHVLNLLLDSSFCNFDTTLQVSCSTSMILGYVEQTSSILTTNFNILDPKKEKIFIVRGPETGGGFMSDAVYTICPTDGSSTLGNITCVWRGFSKKVFCLNDKYSVEFPNDLDVKVKALLVSCAIYLDLLQHEETSHLSQQ
ncbi:phospholipid scramblase 2-like [Rhinophrynus dorsalis]